MLPQEQKFKNEINYPGAQSIRWLPSSTKTSYREEYVSQSDSEQQLRIWKDLAISKQMLMNEAATALKLKDDFTAEDLKDALTTAVTRSRDADINMAASRGKAAESIAEMEKTVKKVEKGRKDAEVQRDEAIARQEQAEQQLANGRRDNAESLKKAKRQVEEKQKELKAINLALADTPENIVKKLKALKKQKLDENVARKLAEDSNRVLKKENKTQKEELESLGTLTENSTALLQAYRMLKEWSDDSAEKLKTAGIDINDVPEIDASVLAGIESFEEEEEDTLEAATA